MRLIVSLLFLFVSNTICAQNISIIPEPARVNIPFAPGNFTITPSTPILLEGSGLENAANFFNDYLKQVYGFSLKVLSSGNPSNAIALNYERMDNTAPGAYTMNVGNNQVYIAGDNADGVFFGIQTLIQLLPTEKSTSLKIPFVNIIDSPRFEYRGLHLDVGRHFFSVSFVKKYLDYMALHKLNYFHWHLTEDQGWRIEIKKYPRLTSVGGYRNGTIIGRFPGNGNDNLRYGGFYTQEEIKEVVAYAAKRHITVVPEIEMPGHGSAAIAAYPELSCFPQVPTIRYYPKQSVWAGDSTGKQVQQTWGVFDDVFCAGKENTFKFLQDVLDEVMPLFPGKYIHVGGDECPKSNWEKCPSCQQRMKENNLKDEHALQSYFIQRMEKYINSKGKTLVGWDEILEGGLAPNAVVMSWRGEEGGIAAAKQNHNVIMTPDGYVYLNYSQTKNEDSVTIGGYLPLEKVYNYEPIPAALPANKHHFIVGAQANVWTEYIGNEKLMEYTLFPRLSALSEVLWSGKKKKNWKFFEPKLLKQFQRYDLWKTNYSKAFYDLKANVIQTPKGIVWRIKSNYECESCYVEVDRIRILQQDTSIKAMVILPDFEKDPTGEKGITKDSMVLQILHPGQEFSEELKKFPRQEDIVVKTSQTLAAQQVLHRNYAPRITQQFFFNKATAKKITLKNQPSKNYPGDGAFTLVNGMVNEKGLGKSEEFLGFNGADLDATIDLGKAETVKEVAAGILEQNSSWIYRPKSIEVFTSVDGKKFTSAGNSDMFTMETPLKKVGVTFTAKKARYIRVLVKNFGTIPQGNPGGGSPAWLFVDEISVD